MKNNKNNRIKRDTFGQSNGQKASRNTVELTNTLRSIRNGHLTRRENAA